LELFNRKIQVIIDTGAETITIPDQGLIDNGFATNLRISFKVIKTDSKETNEAEIQIFNLSENTRNRISKQMDNKDANVKVSLSVGYGENITRIFYGDLIGYEPQEQKPDSITSLRCKDGWKGLDQVISISFDEGSTTNQILNKIASLAGFSISSNNIENLVYNNGFSYVGKISTALDKVTARIKNEWSIRNNVLLITSINKSNDIIPRIILNKTSGLLEKPRRIKQQETAARGGNQKTFDGWAVKSLIIPSLDIKSLIGVEVNGNQVENFIVKTINFVGDNRENDFFAEMEVVKNG
jgi:hypothetical protein